MEKDLPQLYQRVGALETLTQNHAEELCELKEGLLGTMKEPGLKQTILSTSDTTQQLARKFELLENKLNPVLEDRIKVKTTMFIAALACGFLGWLSNFLTSVFK